MLLLRHDGPRAPGPDPSEDMTKAYRGKRSGGEGLCSACAPNPSTLPNHRKIKGQAYHSQCLSLGFPCSHRLQEVDQGPFVLIIEPGLPRHILGTEVVTPIDDEVRALAAREHGLD